MAKLLLFAPFFATAIDKDENQLSLFGLIESIGVPVRPGKSVPEDAVAPRSWAIISVWYREPSDEAKEFEQRTWLEQPNGGRMAELDLAFRWKDAVRTQRNRTNINGIPVGVDGEMLLKLSIRERVPDGEWSDWVEVASYPIGITHTQSQSSDEEEAEG